MQQYQKAENDLIQVLQYVGEGFVKEARMFTKKQGGFGDITGNLRSSIGYFIVRDGEVITANLKPSKKGSDRRTGMSVASDFINKIKQNNGLFLYGVAGMDYAKAVESKGYNVISYQADLAIIELKSILREL